MGQYITKIGICPYHAPIFGGGAARDLNAEKDSDCSSFKYALARQRWDEPLKNAMNLKE